MANKGVLAGEVRITGVINDQEFSATGRASGDPSTGEYDLQLEYERIPADWHPLMYLDPKIGLLFHREEGRGRNVLNARGKGFRSSGTIDLGDGNVLRNNAVIRVDGDRISASYVMYGTARTGDLAAVDFFEETVLPFGPGKLAGLAIARWKRSDGSTLDGLLSTRYEFDPATSLERPQLRKMEATASLDGGKYHSQHRGLIRHLGSVVEEGGPYIGHLIG